LPGFNQHHKPFIKICGLTQPDNAMACANLGADAIGLVFYKKSPRYVTIDQARQITDALADNIHTIGVFVDEPYSSIIDHVDQCGLSGVQLHGNESPDLVKRLSKRELFVIKALFAGRPPYIDRAKDYTFASALLMEYGKGGLPGGNAETWDYSLAMEYTVKQPVILAGGLSIDNVGEAVHKVNPFGVDISSGVEKECGIKDLDKVKTFIKNASLTSSTQT
jgi:phosphoribosylanthranilate isomerase